MTPPSPPAPPTQTRGRLSRALERPLGAAIAACAWLGLIIQYAVFVAAGLEKLRSLLGTTVRYFGFFTILSNLLIAVGLTARLVAPSSRPGRFFARPSVAAASALYIAVVALVYDLVLRRMWSPTGWQLLADVLLHDLVPASYVLYWGLVLPRARLPWRAAVTWLLFPACYFAYTLVRAPWVGGYPYSFLDARALGYGPVLLNGLYLLLVFLVLGLGLIAVARWLGRRT